MFNALLLAPLLLTAAAPAVDRTRSEIKGMELKIESVDSAIIKAASELRFILSAVGIDHRREVAAFEKIRQAKGQDQSPINVPAPASVSDAQLLVEYLRSRDAREAVEDAFRRASARAPKSAESFARLAARFGPMRESIWIDLRYGAALRSRTEALRKRLARLEGKGAAQAAELNISDIVTGDVDLAERLGVPSGRPPLIHASGSLSAMLRSRRYPGGFDLRGDALVPVGEVDSALEVARCTGFDLSLTVEFTGNGGLALSFDDGKSIFAIERSDQGTMAWVDNRGRTLFTVPVHNFKSGCTVNLRVADGIATLAVDGEKLYSGEITVDEGNLFLCRPHSPHGDLDLRITRLAVEKID